MTKIRVILADDHAMFREGIRDLLQRYPDIEVIAEASDGNEAISLTDEKLPDVVLMDIGMPNVSGLEATKIIKQRHPSIEVLVLTVYEDDEYLGELFRAGATGYVLKTASGEELIQAIRTVKVGSMVMSRAMRKTLLHHATNRPLQTHSGQDIPDLTPRETQVLQLAAKGMSNHQIASELHIGVATVKGHLVNVFSKMGVDSRTEAVLQALKQGLVGLDDTL